MPRPPETPIIFTEHDDIMGMPFVGYRPHMEAGIGMGRKAAEEGKNYRVSLVGYPGTGKTVYPQILARELPGYSFLYMKGNSLLRLGDAGEILRELKNMESYLRKAPLIIAFDELDLLTPSRIIRPIGYTLVTGVMMDILDEKPEKTLTLVMANNPNNLDMAITSRLQYTLFFDLPDARVLGETLEGLTVPNPYEVGERLYAMAEKSNGRLVVRSVVQACGEMKERPNDPEKMAQLLFPHAPQFDLGQIAEYSREHTGYRMRSNAAIEYWQGVAQNYKESDKGTQSSSN